MRVGDQAFFYHSSCKVWERAVCDPCAYRTVAGRPCIPRVTQLTQSIMRIHIPNTNRCRASWASSRLRRRPTPTTSSLYVVWGRVWVYNSAGDDGRRHITCRYTLMYTHPGPPQDKASEYFDAGSSKESPRWLMVDVQLKETLPHMVRRFDAMGRVWGFRFSDIH